MKEENIDGKQASMYFDVTMRKDHLLLVLNKLFDIHPIKLQELNAIIPFEKEIGQLRILEVEHKEIGIANYEKPNEGISVTSLIASITDLLVGDRLAFVMDENNFIIGVSWHKDSSTTSSITNKKENLPSTTIVDDSLIKKIKNKITKGDYRVKLPSPLGRAPTEYNQALRQYREVLYEKRVTFMCDCIEAFGLSDYSKEAHHLFERVWKEEIEISEFDNVDYLQVLQKFGIVLNVWKE